MANFIMLYYTELGWEHLSHLSDFLALDPSHGQEERWLYKPRHMPRMRMNDPYLSLEAFLQDVWLMLTTAPCYFVFSGVVFYECLQALLYTLYTIMTFQFEHTRDSFDNSLYSLVVCLGFCASSLGIAVFSLEILFLNVLDTCLFWPIKQWQDPNFETLSDTIKHTNLFLEILHQTQQFNSAILEDVDSLEEAEWVLKKERGALRNELQHVLSILEKFVSSSSNVSKTSDQSVHADESANMSFSEEEKRLNALKEQLTGTSVQIQKPTPQDETPNLSKLIAQLGKEYPNYPGNELDAAMSYRFKVDILSKFLTKYMEHHALYIEANKLYLQQEYTDIAETRYKLETILSSYSGVG